MHIRHVWKASCHAIPIALDAATIMRVAQNKKGSGLRRPPRIGKKPAHQHFSARAPEGTPPCDMTSRADNVKTVLVLIADGGAVARLGQGGDQDEGAKNDFRWESWKHSGCNHAAYRQ